MGTGKLPCELQASRSSALILKIKDSIRLHAVLFLLLEAPRNTILYVETGLGNLGADLYLKVFAMVDSVCVWLGE